MRLRSFWVRCMIANVVGELLAMGALAAAIVALVAHARDGGGWTAAFLAIILMGGIVGALVALVLRVLRCRSLAHPDPCPDDPSAIDFDLLEAEPRFAPSHRSGTPPPPRLHALRPGGAALRPEGGAPFFQFGPSWQPSATVAEAAPDGAVWLGRLGADLRALLENDIQTRQLLARDVYRVPEEWLDDVLRVRTSAPER